jgi:hypothetical protein
MVASYLRHTSIRSKSAKKYWRQSESFLEILHSQGASFCRATSFGKLPIVPILPSALRTDADSRGLSISFLTFAMIWSAFALDTVSLMQRF